MFNGSKTKMTHFKQCIFMIYIVTHLLLLLNGSIILPWNHKLYFTVMIIFISYLILMPLFFWWYNSYDYFQCFTLVMSWFFGNNTTEVIVGDKNCVNYVEEDMFYYQNFHGVYLLVYLFFLILILHSNVSGMFLLCVYYTSM